MIDVAEQEAIVYAIELLKKLGKKPDVDGVIRIIKAAGVEPDVALTLYTIETLKDDLESRHGLPRLLGDDEGTSSPAATSPKIYTGGSGDDRDPPVGAGATNQRKNTTILQPEARK